MHQVVIVLAKGEPGNALPEARRLISKYVDGPEEMEEVCQCVSTPAHELACKAMNTYLGQYQSDEISIQSMLNENPEIRAVIHDGPLLRHAFESFQNVFERKLIKRLEPKTDCVLCQGDGITVNPTYMRITEFDSCALGGRWKGYFSEDKDEGVMAPASVWLSLLQKDPQRYTPTAVVEPDGSLFQMENGYTVSRWQKYVLWVAERHAKCTAVVVDVHW